MMDLRESIRMASLDIRVNKTRTLLSMLGIIIGIASVIIIVALGNGLKYKILEQFSGFGANRVYISQGWDPMTQRSGEITLNDIAVLKNVSGVVDITPQVNWNSEVKSSVKSQPMDIRGVTEDFFQMAGFKLDYGRLLTSTDIDFRQKVCVLKAEAASSLFSTKENKENVVINDETAIKEALGKTIKISGQRYMVIGILNKEQSSMGFFWTPPNTIFIPVTVVLRVAQMKNVPSIIVQVDNAKDTKKVGNEIVKVLKDRHKFKGRYNMMNPDDIQREVNLALNIFTLVIGGIGGLSLLVGGIGIMNIMLASVAERTREIGIRKAIGAKRRDILLQFLIEAGSISGCGGVIGIILGIGLAKSITILTQNNMPSVILPSSIIIAFLFSIMVGMFFGIYPSSKAANLNPMEALRYE